MDKIQSIKLTFIRGGKEILVGIIDKSDRAAYKIASIIQEGINVSRQEMFNTNV